MKQTTTVETLEQLAAIVAPEKQGKEATDAALRFLSLFEASQIEDFGHKDFAHMFLIGLPSMADSWSESLANVGQFCRDYPEDEGDQYRPTTADEVVLVAEDLGWL